MFENAQFFRICFAKSAVMTQNFFLQKVKKLFLPISFIVRLIPIEIPKKDQIEASYFTG
jgi:hypothetical protein